jgi:hypothetical protein
MKPYLTIALAAVLTAGCASLDVPPLPPIVAQTPPDAPMAPVTALRPFDDIVIPGGLTYQPSRSTIIESPVAKSARLVYVGTLPADMLRDKMRIGLEGNAWRHITTTTSPDLGTILLFEKDSGSLQVIVRDVAPYSELHLVVSRAVPRPAGSALPAAAVTR